MSLLVDVELVRLRPGMFIGSTIQFGVQHLVFEAIDNAIDQYLANKASRVAVATNGRTVRVSDVL